jgi:ubiquinone/menaquinone biosynthesis C-methylase UbiE
LGKQAQNNALKVKQFYDDNTSKFLAVYGNIIQAFRTVNIEDYLNYTIQSAGIKPGMRLLDAGCGVCGPAIYFANTIQQLSIEACTVSEVQFEIAQKEVIEKGLSTSVKVHQLDYHQLDKHFASASFDMIYFLESFGHSNQKEHLINTCWNILKPGGKLYIKDLFKRLSNDEWEQLRIDEICSEINYAYEYEIADLSELLVMLRSKGFELKVIKVPEIEMSNFERLSISNDFQNLFNIGKIDSWDNYIFPIDFFEIILVKPTDLTFATRHLYSLNK